MQNKLQRFLSSPSNLGLTEALDAPYRRNVRRAMPFSIQDEIRTKCGDQSAEYLGIAFVTLPSSCDIEFPVVLAKAAAAELRERKDLRDDLRWHLNSVEVALINLDTEYALNERVSELIEARYR